MKNKFLIILPVLICSFVYVNAQDNNALKSSKATKVMTVAEANALNGIAQPTVNGKPYSQYKAEQEALKNKQQAIKPEVIMPGVKLGSSEDMKAINAPQKIVTTTSPTVTPTEVNNATAPASFVTLPITAYNGEVQPAATVDKLKPSATPAATKVPVVPMQTEKPKGKD